MIEPPYPQIWKDLKEGRLIPFLGAGASRIGPPGSTWDSKDPVVLPSGAQLSQFLFQQGNFPSDAKNIRSDLVKVATYYNALIGRRRLTRILRDVFSREYPGTKLHDLLASVPTHLLIVSTNYDTLIEDAFRSAGKPYDLIVYPSDDSRTALAEGLLWWKNGNEGPIEKNPKDLHINLDERSVIYKMHGSMHPSDAMRDSWVITEDDYVEFLSRMAARTAIPHFFYRYAHTRRFLFLGYSLGDWNVRVLLRKLGKELDPRLEPPDGAEGDESSEDLEQLESDPHWAIQLKPTKLESRLWLKRNVEIFNVPLDTFASKLWDARES